MTKGKKKVVSVIVEGPSDESALGLLLTDYFSSDSVRFVIIHGDITTQIDVTPENIISRIDEFIHEMMGKYHYNETDMKRIIHIVDTDGAFIPSDAVHESEIDLQYHIDHIETDHVEKIVARNKKKANLLYKLHKTGNIHKIPYRVYYNSRNLEHVLNDVIEDLTDEEKRDKADEFAELYEDNLEGFIELITQDEISVPGSYQQTWKYIEKNCHSLERHTNMRLIFEE